MFVLKNSKKNHPLNNPSVLLFCAQFQQIQTPKWLILRHRTPFSGRKTPRRTWWRGGKSCGPAPDWLRSSSRPVKCRPEGSGSCPSIQLSDSNVSLKESPNLISFGSRYTSYTFLTYLYINIWRKLIACATLIGSWLFDNLEERRWGEGDLFQQLILIVYIPCPPFYQSNIRASLHVGKRGESNLSPKFTHLTVWQRATGRQRALYFPNKFLFVFSGPRRDERIKTSPMSTSNQENFGKPLRKWCLKGGSDE
jgi:hypothetical protein